MSRLPSRPCLALPFTILTGPDRVRLIAGEDFRYTFEAEGLETWLPELLPKLDGRHPLDQLLATLAEDRRANAEQLLARLCGERVLVDGPAPAAHCPAPYQLRVEGNGALLEGLKQSPHPESEKPPPEVTVLCQDRLDYDEVLRFNERRLKESGPYLWLTCGPLNRGYVSPAFLPDAGPCLACLLTHFQRLSPAPELYGDLIDHARQGKSVQPSPFSRHGIALLEQLLLWKVELLQQTEPPAALFQLHVLEIGTLEITAHRVFSDPECAACSGRR